VLGGKRVERQHVVLGLLEHCGDLRQPALELLDGVAQSLAGLLAVVGGEDRTDDRAQSVVLIAADVTAHVAEKVHGAALPRRAERLRQCGLQAGVRVTDGKLHADQAPREQRPEELAPERLGLRRADVQADDLPTAGLVHGVRDHDALARDAPAVADLLDLGVDEAIRIATLQRPLAERLHRLVEQSGDPADLGLGDAQPQALDQLVDATRRDAAHVRLLHDRDQRLLAALAWLQKRGEVAALPDPR
jgi:hypothetical protein